MKHEIAEDLYRAIFHRKSVRKYSRQEISQETLQKIEDFWEQTEQINPEEPVIMRILPAGHIKMRVGMSYRAPYYIAVYAADTEKGLLNAGFRLQQMDLWLSAHGIGSCWLHMMTPDQANAMADGMACQITMGIGYSEEKLHRSESSEFKRKKLEQITNGGDYDTELEAVRIAPSATNSQLWYFEQTGAQIRAYMIQDNQGGEVYRKLHEMDMGIALCHLYLAASYKGMFRGFAYENEGTHKTGAAYILSVILKQPKSIGLS